MARIGDVGAYAPSNVKCILHSKNASESAGNDSIAFGSKAGQAVLNDASVLEIYTSNEAASSLGSRYGISLGTINDIRSRRTWRRATADIVRVSLRGRNQWI
jgi:hypothetical protein